MVNTDLLYQHGHDKLFNAQVWGGSNAHSHPWSKSHWYALMFFSSVCVCVSVIMLQWDGWCSSLSVSEVSSTRARCARETELNLRLGDLSCQFTCSFSLPSLPQPLPPPPVSFLSVLPSSVILSLSSHPVHPVFSPPCGSTLTAPGKSFALSVLMPQINYSYVVSVLCFFFFFFAISGVSWLWGKKIIIRKLVEVCVMTWMFEFSFLGFETNKTV